MRSSARLGALLVTLSALVTAPAAALTQPDGTPIPQGAGLQDLFTSRGEALDALADALTVPETFVPSCNLTFEVLQRNAGYQNAFGWYNVTGSAPGLGDLHEFLHCTDGVGTIKPLPNIKNDPAYLGGEIGFYQGVIDNCGPGSGPADYLYVFYSQKGYNPDSSQQNPYVHLLVYNSTVVPKAFYFGWEDLISGGDNDFDDLTTFVTGISCTGGGGACETGAPGVCGTGTLQCQGGALACLPLAEASTEACNGLDDDCDGEVDDGDVCPAGEVCDNGACVPPCATGETVCPGGTVCDLGKGVCVEPACNMVDCEAGTKCVGGECVEPCAGAICPPGQVCNAGLCVDPCGAITCDDGQLCVAGACVEACQCAGCGPGQQCQPDGLCLFDACVGVMCPPGTACAADGSCVDVCDAVVCPAGQACVTGECVPSTGAGGAGGNNEGGFSFGGMGGSAGGAGGAGGQGGAAAGAVGGGGGASGLTGESSGCGCKLASGPEPSPRAPWLAGLVAGLLVWRRRRSIQLSSHRAGRRARAASVLLATWLVATLSLFAAGCGGEPSHTSIASSTSSTSTASTSAASTSTSTAPDAPPSAVSPPPPEAPAKTDATSSKAVAQEHGREYWTVYTAVGASQDAPAVQASIADLKKRGLTFGLTFGYGTLGCDGGSAAALRASADLGAVGVYFASEADAKAFAATLTKPALAVAKIKAMCRD